jgi:hypothetical protein
MLRFGVQRGDGDAAVGLLIMSETSALPDLHTALNNTVGHNKISIAQAINVMSGGEESSLLSKQLP